MTTARGIRNNNPGNIDYNPANQWRGQLPHDPKIESRFARFDSAENGVRALVVLLRTYRRKYGLDTVAGLIGRWAPDSENNTAAYVRSVERRLDDRLGVKPGQALDMGSRAVLIELATAIIVHENGRNPYPESVISSGVERALA